MRYIILVICMMAGSAYADSLNLQLPSAPGSYQSDKFKSGLGCSS